LKQSKSHAHNLIKKIITSNEKKILSLENLNFEKANVTAANDDSINKNLAAVAKIHWNRLRIFLHSGLTSKSSPIPLAS